MVAAPNAWRRPCLSSSELAILVLGAGSIGARHAQNLRTCGARVFVADPDRDRARAVEGATCVPYSLDGLGRYDGIVVASPTREHSHQAAAALAEGCHVLVEKPLAITMEDAANIMAAGGDRVMVGFNLRFHRPMQRFASLLRSERVGTPRHARLWFGYWLPDWRPSIDYRVSYSARARLGGGILMDAIHELDIAIWLFGDRLKTVGSIIDKLGTLEIDVEDTVVALLRRDDGLVVTVSLDYLSRRYRRGVEVVGEHATIRLDWSRHVLEVENAAGVVSELADDDLGVSYEKEAAHFLAWIRGETVPPVDALGGAASVRLVDDIRRAAL